MECAFYRLPFTKIGEVKLPSSSESYAYMLVIPNKEVRECLYSLGFREWFVAVVAKMTMIL